MIYLRVNSHRAGRRLAQILGGPLDYHYTWETGGCLVPVTPEQVDQVKAEGLIGKGVTRARIPKGTTPRRCWRVA